jgi:regulator of sirC expression with transglutaminase-like and TPR domain
MAVLAGNSCLNALPIDVVKKLMSSIGLPERTIEPRDAEKKALMNLLSDEDSGVYQTIRAKILTYGFSATRWLQPATLSSDAVLRRRAMEIIQFLSRQASDNRFLGFCLTQGEELDIEEGSLLLAQTQYPEINTLAYQALFDSYAADLKEQLDPNAAAEQVIAVINHYLFEELGYHGNEENYYDPDNSYLNRVVDRRTGNPISLCSLYLVVARRLKLPMVGIGMPGHFLCRYQTASEDALFIDAFNRGKLLTKADCVKYLVHTRDGFKESYLAPITGRRTLLRMCSNLHQIYSQLSLSDEMSRCQRYIVALAK